MPSPRIRTPYILSVPYRTDSQTLFSRLHNLTGAVWLDSGKHRSYSARYDIISALPREQVTSLGDACRVDYRHGGSKSLPLTALAYVEQQLKQLGWQPSAESADTDGPFTGGAIGYLGYEALHGQYGLPSPPGDPDWANIYFGIYDWALIQDHLEQRSYAYFLGDCPESLIQRIEQTLADASPTPAGFQCGPLLPDISQQDYIHAVEQVQRYIRAGDCYQVNFTQRFSGDFSGSTAAAYLHLREALPSPFSAYMSTPAGAILSLSPERFIEQHGRHLRTQPIKGTAPRGKTAAEDAALASELQRSDKNRAENVMIVDLLRNDLSKVCEPFSVAVPELFSLQSFANVHHLVSTVVGKMRNGLTSFDLLHASFPGGSITGAPKKRAMEIINELEPSKRGVYCGSVLYLSLNGRMDSNIAIRTLVQAKDRIYCWGGGGVVADSDPKMEYQESLHKIQLLLERLHAGISS